MPNNRYANLDGNAKISESYTQINDGFTTVQSDIDAHKAAATLDHPDGSVTTAKLADKAVTRAKIGDKAVGTGQIGDAAVATGQLADGSVTQPKLGSKAVGTAQLADKAVTQGQLGDAAIGTTQIADGAITAAKVMGKAIGTSQLADKAVGTVQLGDKAVGTGQIADKAVGQAQLGDAAVGTAQLEAGAVTAAKVAADVATQAKLDAHVNDTGPHISAAERTKLTGIAAGAQVNQNAFAQVNDVSAGAASDTLTIEGGTGITITTEPATKKVRVTATGTATPGAHASSHIPGGSDVIPDATTSKSGLLSAADKTRLSAVTNAATPNTIPIRDASGRFQVAAPVLAAEVARKDTVDSAVQPLQADLANTAPVALSLVSGQQIVTVPRDTPFNVLSIKGRTLVNLLGRDGNCESVAPFSYVSGAATPSTAATSSADATIGTLGIRLTWNAANMGASYFRGRPITNLEAGKRYVALMDVNSDGLGITGRLSVRRAAGTYWHGNVISSGASPSCLFFVAEGGESHIGIYANVSNFAGKVGFDAVRCYEITQTEYDALAAMTPAQIAAKYPYVDDVKNVNGVYVRKPGVNLVPPFSEWKLNASASIVEPYKLSLTTVGNNYTSYVAVDVIPNTNYTMMSDFTGYIGIYTADGSTAIVPYAQVPSGVAKTFNTGANTQIRYYYSNAALGAGTFTLSNPMLSLGSYAFAFVPKDDQYVFYPDANLAASLDGSVYDELYTDSNGQARVKRMFKSMELTGDLPWTFLGGTTGYKTVIYKIGSPLKDTGQVVKYDGKILSRVNQGGTISSGDQQVVSDSTDANNPNIVGVTILNTDSGWGDSYTPSVDEVKAYFYGWKMSGSGTNSSTLYTSGTKYWWVMNLDGTVGGVTATLPIQQGIVDFKYRLQYQLAAQVDEPTRSEGAIMLNEGANTIEVGTGAVVKEKANPNYYSSDGQYYINNSFIVGSTTRYRQSKLLQVFRNRTRDSLWAIAPGAGSVAGMQAAIPASLFNPSAVYEVTYLALDTYQIGIAPSLVAAQYAPNAREVTDGLVKVAGQLGARVAVLENGTAQAKQPQWITPTLLNGWVQHSDAYYNAAYRKVGDEVQLRGLIKSGSVNSVALVLAPTYRPKFTVLMPLLSSTITNDHDYGNVEIRTNGEVFVYGISNNWLTLDGVRFFLN